MCSYPQVLYFYLHEECPPDISTVNSPATFSAQPIKQANTDSLAWRLEPLDKNFPSLPSRPLPPSSRSIQRHGTLARLSRQGLLKFLLVICCKNLLFSMILQIVNLEKPFETMCQNKKLKTWPTYTTTGCLFECVMEAIIKICKCRSAEYAGLNQMLAFLIMPLFVLVFYTPINAAFFPLFLISFLLRLYRVVCELVQ